MEAVALWIGVALLGSVGACGRFLLDRALQSGRGGELPVGTLAVNVSGSFLLGLLLGLDVGGDGLLLAGTALLGAYTTFSTWMFESHRLLEEDERATALLNVALSLAAGLLAAGGGWAIGAAL